MIPNIATDLDQQEGFSLKRSRRAARKSLAKLLLGNKSTVWIFITLAIIPFLFLFFASFGRQAHLASVAFENRLACVFFTVYFTLAIVGFGAHERDARFKFGAFFSRSILSLLTAVALSSLTLYFAFFIQVGRYSLVYGALGSCAIYSVVLGLTHRWLRRYAYRYIVLGPETELTKLLKKWDFREQGSAKSEKTAPTASKFERTEFDSKTFENSDKDSLANNSVESFDSYRAFFRENSLCDLVLSDNLDPNDRVLGQATMAALQSGIRVVSAPEFYAEFSQRYPVEILPLSWAVHAGFDVSQPIRNLLKRVVDILLSAIMIVVSMPFLLLIGLAVWATSPGPVLYIQERRGRFSRSFRMLKFRTMDAHHQGPETTDQMDPRVTMVGKILRPLHLDELPQFFNIFVGDMSFVGPRPESRAIADMARGYSVLYELRHMVRPGLSGLAQIRQGKTGSEPDVILEKLSYDLYYIRNHSIPMDLWIMFRTIFVLAKRAW